jgi:hypothetical protein
MLHCIISEKVSFFMQDSCDFIDAFSTAKYILYWWERERKRALGRPRSWWVDNIKLALKEIGWVGIDWIDLAQDKDKWMALVNTVMNLRVP